MCCVPCSAAPSTSPASPSSAGSFLLPANVRDDVLPYLPSNAGSAFTNVTPTPDLLNTGTGAAVFTAWILVPLANAAVRLVRQPV